MRCAFEKEGRREGGREGDWMCTRKGVVENDDDKQKREERGRGRGRRGGEGGVRGGVRGEI